MRANYYEPTKEREYVIINNKPVKTISLQIGQPRIRITLDQTKWIVTHHMADSGSIVAVLITPKEKKKGAAEK